MTRSYQYSPGGNRIGTRLDLGSSSWLYGWNCDAGWDDDGCDFWYLTTGSGENTGDWSKVMWPDPSDYRQMVIKGMAGSLNSDGSPFLVVIGGDNALIYRIGNATNDFAVGAKTHGFFIWDPTESDPRMKANDIVDVTTDTGGLITVSVIGGDSKTCHIQQTRQNEAVFSAWRCV
jgi:hypothetical protein